MGQFDIITTHIFRSPVGDILLGTYGESLCLCDWYEASHRQTVDHRIQRSLHACYRNGWSDALSRTVAQLTSYFDSPNATLSMPLITIGSDFQKRVWVEICNIPCGETLTYKELAANAFGNSIKVRAVGGAVAANALSLFIPCHRVLGSDSLGGYAGGLEAKEYLLQREQYANILVEEACRI